MSKLKGNTCHRPWLMASFHCLIVKHYQAIKTTSGFFFFHFCSVLWNFVWITLNFNFKVLRIFYIQVMYQELKNNHRIFFKSFNLSDGILTVYLWCNRSKLRMFSTASSNVSSMLFCNWIDFLVFPNLFFQRFI